MLNLKNTLDGYLKNVEVIGNTIQDTNNLANIRSVGDKVKGQELYKIDVVSCGKNLFNPSKYKDITTNCDYTISGGYKCNYIKLKPNTDYTVSAGASDNAGALFINVNREIFRSGYLDLRLQTSVSKTYRTDDTGLLYIGTSSSNNALIELLLDRNIQIEEGTQATPYEPYQEQKLEILSPVQLEKVGDVADRIICKDGVWGVEKNIETILFDGSDDEDIAYYNNYIIFNAYKYSTNYKATHTLNVITWNGVNKFCMKEDTVTNKSGAMLWLKSNPVTIKLVSTQSVFIPLPHDQQVKLRTFAGQTNIAFLTEIPGQVKAQVPKSLGATVNTHTEQIADLHNSLERVKKLEETTVSTVETESNFTTVDATNNGYFEDVKLEGKTLVNLLEKTKVSSAFNKYEAILNANRLLSPSTKYTFLIKNNGTDSLSVYFNENLFENGGRGINIPPNGTYIACISTLQLTVQTVLIRALSNDGTFYDLEGVLLEGDHTNNPPEFFEGLVSVGQDVEEVSVESISGNLFDGELIPNNIDLMATGSNNICSKNFIPVEEGQKYILSSELGYHFELFFYDDSFKGVHFMQLGGSWDFVKPVFVVPSGYKYLKFRTWSNENNTDVKICVSKFKDNPLYIPHQVNKKPLLYFNPTAETWEKPILREWDTIEKHSDGKYYYHKRSGEVVLNGGDNQSIVLQKDFLNQDATIGFNISRIALDGNSDVGKNDSYCDKFNCYVQNKLHNTDIEGISQGYYAIYVRIAKSKLSTQDVSGFKAWLKANPTTVVYQLKQEEVYECTNIDLMTYSGETNYIINSGAISPKSLLKVHNNISNVVKILQEKVSLLENTFIAGLKSVLSGDMYSLATILYPEDFEQNDNTEQDIMVIPE